MLTLKVLAVAHWVFQVMTTIVPLEKVVADEDEHETVAQAEVRYHQISEAIATVVMDDSEKSLFWNDVDRFKTLGLVIATARRESGFAREVDYGIGSGVGDHGTSWCMMQVHLMGGRRIVMNGSTFKFDPKGWSGRDLVQDRTKCFRAGLHMLRGHWNWCSQNPYQYRLASYLSGFCDVAKDESAKRVGLAGYISQLRFPPKISEND